MKVLQRRIRQILLKYPQTRDDDKLLMLYVWIAEKPSLKNITFMGFANEFKGGKLSHPMTIVRNRAKLQEKDVMVRGKLYDKRHNYQKEFVKQINNV